MYLISIKSIYRNKQEIVYIYIYQFIQQTLNEPDYTISILTDSDCSWRNRHIYRLLSYREVMATTSHRWHWCWVITCQATGSCKALLFINLTTILGDKYYYCFHFSDEKTEAQRAFQAQSHTVPSGRLWFMPVDQSLPQWTACQDGVHEY